VEGEVSEVCLCSVLGRLGDAKEPVAGILSMRVLVSETETQWKEATMVLSNYKVGAGLAVSDMDRAREFYEGKLGLSVSIDSAENVQYRCAEDSVLHITSPLNTLASPQRP
jgi:catechol-2,3-dioxygenase